MVNLGPLHTIPSVADTSSTTVVIADSPESGLEAGTIDMEKHYMMAVVAPELDLPDTTKATTGPANMTPPPCDNERQADRNLLRSIDPVSEARMSRNATPSLVETTGR